MTDSVAKIFLSKTRIIKKKVRGGWVTKTNGKKQQQ